MIGSENTRQTTFILKRLNIVGTCHTLYCLSNYRMSKCKIMGWSSKYLLLLFMVSTCGFFSVRYSGYELNTMLTQYTRELLHGMGIRDHQSVTIKAFPSNATTLKSNSTTLKSNATILRSNATSTNAPQKPNVVTPYSGNLTFLQVKAMLEREALSVDYDFARRLRKAQTNANYPFVNDIVVSRRNNSWAVYVVINNGNVMNGRRYTSKMNVVLTVGNKTYRNVFAEAPKRFLRVLKYNVDGSLPPVGTLSFHDYSLSFAYRNLPYVALRQQPRRRIAVCAYISNYNTIKEIKSLLAFYLLQKVDAVILYCAINYQTFWKALEMEIQNGFVYLYEFPWPLTRTFGGIQYSVQGSHINSCYYRHRDYFQYIISQDVDEYFYSETYPYDLFRAAQHAYSIYPNNSVLIVSELRSF